MPVVLVHGVPETPAVWEPVRAQLSRTDVVTARLPGFRRWWMLQDPAGAAAILEQFWSSVD